MEKLLGGRPEIYRDADGVHRPVGPWSKNVHHLLHGLHVQGFKAAPTFLGTDKDGKEVVSYISGQVGNDPLPKILRSNQALVSAAILLRSYHEASAKVVSTASIDGWQLPAQTPIEVICHGDFAPYNVVFDGANAVGLIDFDVAHPAPRVWDVAYALYRWAPLTSPGNSNGYGDIQQQMSRAGLFCATYGLSYEGGISAVICRRLNALIQFMSSRASVNDPQYVENIADGHLTLYRQDVEYIMQHSHTIDAAVSEAMS